MCEGDGDWYNILLAILTLFTIGPSVGLFSFLLACSVELRLPKIMHTFFGVLIGALITSIILLLYGFWASLFGRKLAKVVLIYLYSVYAVWLLGFGICLLALRTTVLTRINNFMDRDLDLRTYLELHFDCEWNATDDSSCKNRFEDVYDIFGTWIGLGLIGVCVILVAGDLVAWKNIGKLKNNEDSVKLSLLTLPFSYEC
jgi:hypothetical protein